MNDSVSKEKHFDAKLVNIENDLAEFLIDSKIEECESTFFWPADKLPEGIEIGDEIIVTIDFKNKEEKIVKIKQKQEKEKKYNEMRKLLEELVN